MAAGLGFKDFTTGEVLTAADVDGYLMQGVWVFASATARDAAVTSPQEGNFAYLKDTNVTTYYTGSAWANLDTTGMTNPMTTTGDTIYSSSGSTPARLGIGTAGQVLTVNSGATAPEWKTPAAGGGGKVLQVVSTTYTTRTDVASTTYTDTGLSLSITPSLATSKVLVLITHNIYVTEGGGNPDANIRIMRDSTAILNNINLASANGSFKYSTLNSAETNGVSWSYLDSPATTSAITYKTQMAVKNTANGSNISVNVRSGSDSTITLLEIGA
jgi:hypothetical protein